MKMKKQRAKRAKRALCAFLAAICLCGVLPSNAFAVDMGKISEIGTKAEQPTVVDLGADTKLSALAKQLGLSVNDLRCVRIYYAGNTDNCVDIPADRIHRNGTQGILYEAHFANLNQLFVLNPVGNGYYQIICLESGKLLEGKDSSRNDCAEIVQRSIHGNPNGKWRMIHNNDGTTSFQNMATGGFLNACGGRADASKLIQYHDDGTIAKKFYVKNVSEDELLCAIGGRFVRILYAINPNMCIDVPAEGIWNNGTQLQLWARSYGNQNQVYVLENTGSGWTIKNHQSGKIIEVRNSSHQNGAQVAQWDPHNSACARWDILSNIDGRTVSFRNRESGKYLNLCGGGTGKNGQKFIQYYDDNSESMRFRIEVMRSEDVLSAVYERAVKPTDLNWTEKYPWHSINNETDWTLWKNGKEYYPSADQKVFVSAEYLSPNAVALMLKERAYSQSTLKKIKDVLAGEGGEEAVAYLLKKFGFKEIPGLGAAMGILQTLLNIQEEDERNRFVDAVNVDARGCCSGVIIYTYQIVMKSRDSWDDTQTIETVTSVEYGSWTGDNFGEVCNLPVSGATGTWHLAFK